MKPNLFIVGAPRSATTTIHTYLSEIQGISMSKIKEPGYFLPQNNMDEKEYEMLFQDKQIRGESTTEYLYDDKVPFLIKEYNPDAKIIISLRNPIDRAYSDYFLKKSKFRVSKSFHDLLIKEIKGEDAGLELWHGLYSKYVLTFMQVFGKNLHIMIYEEFISNQKKYMYEVLSFLGVKNDLLKINQRIINQKEDVRFQALKPIMKNRCIIDLVSKIFSIQTRSTINHKILHKPVKDSKMDIKDRVALNDYFRSDIKNLEEILGRKIPWKFE